MYISKSFKLVTFPFLPTEMISQRLCIQSPLLKNERRGEKKKTDHHLNNIMSYNDSSSSDDASSSRSCIFSVAELMHVSSSAPHRQSSVQARLFCLHEHLNEGASTGE